MRTAKSGRRPRAGSVAKAKPTIDAETTVEENVGVSELARRKDAVVLLVVAFAVFYLVSQPEAAADAVRGALEAVGAAFDAIIRFFRALAG